MIEHAAPLSGHALLAQQQLNLFFTERARARLALRGLVSHHIASFFVVAGLDVSPIARSHVAGLGADLGRVLLVLRVGGRDRVGRRRRQVRQRRHAGQHLPLEQLEARAAAAWTRVALSAQPGCAARTRRLEYSW